MIYQKVKYDFFKFLALMAASCFELVMIKQFWNYKVTEAKILCFWLLFIFSVQVLVGLFMISEKRFLSHKDDMEEKK